MINWGAGFFAGLQLGLIFILLGFEVYFFLIDKWTDKELSPLQVWVLLGLLVVAIGFGTRINFLALVFLPLGYFLLKFQEGRREKRIDQHVSDQDIRNWLYTVEKQPDNLNAYVALGDIYCKRQDFEKALVYYEQAQKIKDLPWVTQKIRVTRRESRIKKGEIWLCPECGQENPGTSEVCQKCQNIRKPLPSIKQDLTKLKREMMLGLVFVLAVPLVFILVWTLLHKLPVFFALVLSFLVMYLILRKFITW